MLKHKTMPYFERWAYTAYSQHIKN